MASSSGSVAGSGTENRGFVKPTGDNLDVFWKYNSYADASKTTIVCDFCFHPSNGGITRAKKHQLGIPGQVKPCRKIPADIKQQLQESYDKKKASVDAFMSEVVSLNEVDESAMEEISSLRAGKRPATGASKTTGAAKKKTSNVKGPMDAHLFENPEVSLKKTQAMAKQTSIKDSGDKTARAMAIQYVARFFYLNSIPFNVSKSKSFKLMIEAVGNFGKHLRPPSYYELRVPLLKIELQLTKEMLKGIEFERNQYGCSIMSDAWTDRKSRTLINFLVNSPSGTVFSKSVDGSSYMKTGLKIFELLDSFVQDVGAENVVQVVSDNGSNYVLAGKYLEEKYPRLFWTPCAAHCLDLILEDIGKLSVIKKTITRAQFLVGFIYNHTMALNIMRSHTGGAELIRSGVTRFATTFLTLQRLYKQKHNLRRMFVSELWLNTKTAKETKAKRAYAIVLMTSFWNEVLYSIKAMGALVEVLRLVDNEKKPAMGYIYEAMDRAKESIAKAFNENERRIRILDCYTDPLGWKDKTRKSGNANVLSDQISLATSSYKSVKDMDKLFLAITELGRGLVGESKARFCVAIDSLSELLRHASLQSVAGLLSNLRSHDKISSIFGLLHSDLHEERATAALEYMSSMVGSVEPDHHSSENSLSEKNFTQGKFSVRSKRRNGRVRVTSEKFKVEAEGISFASISAEDGTTVAGLLPKVQFNLQLSEKEQIDRAKVVLPFEHQGNGKPIQIYDGRRSLEESSSEGAPISRGKNEDSAIGEIIYFRDSDDEMPDSDEDPDDDLDI